MARSKRVLPPIMWRHGVPGEPLFIKEKSGYETYFEFVGGEALSHEHFTVSSRGHWHTFYFNRLHAYKVQRYDEPWISNIAYQSLLRMAEHVMMATFRGFQPHGRVPQSFLMIHDQPVKLLCLKRDYLSFSWKRNEYAVLLERGEQRFIEPEDAPLLPELRMFFSVFAQEIWPRMRAYPSPEEAKQARIKKKLAKASCPALFDPLAVPPVYREPKKKKSPLPRPHGLLQPSLFNR